MAFILSWGTSSCLSVIQNRACNTAGATPRAVHSALQSNGRGLWRCARSTPALLRANRFRAQPFSPSASPKFPFSSRLFATAATGSGKVAVVTGASRGIGRAIALALGEAGCHVVVNYSASEAAATAVVQSIKRAGGEAMAFKADVRQPEQVDALFTAALERLGRVDVAGAVAGGDRSESDRRVSVLAGGRQSDAETALWTHHQHRVGGGPDRQRGPGELRGGQGRRVGADSFQCPRVCPARRDRQRGGSGLYRHRNDGEPAAGADPEDDTAGATGRGARGGRPGAFPGAG
eukprot:ctg_122.g70